MALELDVPELLAFYDENRAVRAHSNAIKTLAGEELGIALLLKCLEYMGYDARGLDSSCTAVAGGAWLDKWVEVKKGGFCIHFQVEVKSWSFHGYGGGQALPVKCRPDTLQKFKIQEWERYWDNENRRFRAPGLDKVLKKMKPLHQGAILPLASLWAAVHPQGLEDALFAMPTGGEGSGFQTVVVFSASAFLRNYIHHVRSNTIRLELPKTEARLEFLTQIFPSFQFQNTASAVTSGGSSIGNLSKDLLKDILDPLLGGSGPLSRAAPITSDGDG